MTADAKQQNGAMTSSSGQPSSPEDAVTADTLRKVAEEVRSAFPRPLRTPELVLIDVDPHRLHAFWTISPATLDAARQALGPEGEGAPMVLRVHQLSETAASVATFDVEIVGLQAQCYVDIWEEARRYSGELGLRRSDGSLISLAASASVEMPRPAPGGAASANAAETPVPPEAASEQASPARPDQPATDSFPLPLENVLTLSSYAPGPETVDFEINAELHVFGRVRPGTKLQLFGRNVPLRPDGSFSITRPLPSGALILSSLLVVGGEESGDQ